MVLAKARKTITMRWLGLLKGTNVGIALKKRKLSVRIIIGRKEAIGEDYY